MFSWNFAKKLFDGFTILRWTDFIRPTEFVQIEKSASQAILSYIIGHEYEERKGIKLDWTFIVESNIYGLLCKIATSDIKSTIGNKIKKDHLDELKSFILKVYFDGDKCRYQPHMLIEKSKLEKYIAESNNAFDCNNKKRIEFEICYIAHKFATYREFKYLAVFNQFSPDKERVENDISTTAIKARIEDDILKAILSDLEVSNSNLSLFFSYFEKLKPQIRWSQTCRIPQTTVLGHSMYVAILTYFSIKCLDMEENADEFLVDSFFAALFHDLPESLTRDIISPVKRSIENLDNELANYEYEEVISKMTIKIDNKKWKNDFLCLLGATGNNNFKPFTDRNYVLGELIEIIDKMAAFVEAKMSVEFGINSEEIQSGIKYTSEKLKDKVISYSSTKSSLGSAKIVKTSRNELAFNDFLASIPQYVEGV